MNNKNSALMAGLMLLNVTLSFAVEVSVDFNQGRYDAIVKAFEAGQLSAKDGDIAIVQEHRKSLKAELAVEKKFVEGSKFVGHGLAAAAVVGGLASIVGSIGASKILSRPENEMTELLFWRSELAFYPFIVLKHIKESCLIFKRGKIRGAGYLDSLKDMVYIQDCIKLFYPEMSKDNQLSNNWGKIGLQFPDSPISYSSIVPTVEIFPEFGAALKDKGVHSFYLLKDVKSNEIPSYSKSAAVSYLYVNRLPKSEQFLVNLGLLAPMIAVGSLISAALSAYLLKKAASYSSKIVTLEEAVKYDDAIIQALTQ